MTDVQMVFVTTIATLYLGGAEVAAFVGTYIAVDAARLPRGLRLVYRSLDLRLEPRTRSRVWLARGVALAVLLVTQAIDVAMLLDLPHWGFGPAGQLAAVIEFVLLAAWAWYVVRVFRSRQPPPL